MKEMVEVVRCDGCDYFVGNDYSNVGHCVMWNHGTIKDGYCHNGCEIGGEEDV